MENTQVGPFRIISRLGSRRQQVFLARQVEQDRDVALKFIKLPPGTDRDKALDKIDREVKFLQELRHPNLVRLFGAGVHEDRIFFASELVKGESLTAIIARRGRLAPDLAVDFASQICNLLEYLHENELLHAKLTPDKVLVGSDGAVKVTDLRINRSRKKRWDAVTTRRELDLAAYMAPEQHLEGATEKSDIYSIGVITYEMLTGKLPYAPDTMGRMTDRKKNEAVPSAAKLVMNCPVWLDKIVTKMLQPDARKRPHTTKAIGMAFVEIKKIDKSKRAAIAQVSGNFNPLTAGSDKTEARRLLGKKKTRNQEDLVPFYEKIWFLVVCLVLIVSLVTFAVWPISTQKLFDRGVALIESEESSDWSKGIADMRKVMDRGQQDFTEQATQHIMTARRRLLVKRAMSGKKTGIQTKFELEFIDAYQLEQDGDLVEALEGYRENLLEHEESKQEHIIEETQARVAYLETHLSLPEGPGEVRALLEEMKKLETKEDLINARKQLTAIGSRYGDSPGYQVVVADAKKLAEDLDAHLANLQTAEDKAAEQSPETESQESDKAIEDGDEPPSNDENRSSSL